jgi:hypothetical protein
MELWVLRIEFNTRSKIMAVIQSISSVPDMTFNTVSFAFHDDEFARVDAVIDDLVIAVRAGTRIDLNIDKYWDNLREGQAMPLGAIATAVFHSKVGDALETGGVAAEILGCTEGKVQELVGPRRVPYQGHLLAQYVKAPV